MILFALGIIAIYMSFWFLVSRIIKRNDVADVAWGFGFVLLAWALFVKSPNDQLAAAVFLVTLWGLRLGIHVFLRNRKKKEDYRYQQWRKEWGKWFTLRSFLQVFMLQGFLLVVISAPLIAMANSKLSIDFNLLHLLGIFIWSIGFFFEAVGDYELIKFTKDPKNKGKIMQAGLWRYSRHPNYFGEVTQWWGIWLISSGASWFIFAVIGPLTITTLILKISGIPLLERKYEGNKEYEQYKARTSKFFPLPHKKLGNKRS